MFCMRAQMRVRGSSDVVGGGIASTVFVGAVSDARRVLAAPPSRHRCLGIAAERAAPVADAALTPVMGATPSAEIVAGVEAPSSADGYGDPGAPPPPPRGAASNRDSSSCACNLVGACMCVSAATTATAPSLVSPRVATHGASALGAAATEPGAASIDSESFSRVHERNGKMTHLGPPV